MKRALVAIALVLGSGAALGQVGNFYTGNELYKYLSSPNSADQSHALGYIAGVHDVNRVRGEFCIPAGRQPLSQLRDIVTKHLRDNPETRDQDGDLLVATALTRVWPCPKPPPSKPAPTPDKPGTGRQGS